MSELDARTRWLALYVLCLASLMIVLDVSIVGVALPSIQDDLGFSETSLAWVVNAYLLTYGGFLLLGGRLGDLYGHRRLFLIGISLFTVASLACGLSTTQGMLVVSRGVQGLGGAIASAVSLSLMVNLFTEPGERAKAMGIFGFVASGGGSIGVLLGGIITDVISWHWIFLVNFPIGVVVVLLSLRLLPEVHIPTSLRLDVAGAVTITGALIVAVYAIVNANENGWTSAETLGLLGVAVALFVAFLLREIRAPSPLVPLRLFKIRNLATADVVGVLWAGAMFAWFFLTALYMQLVLGYSPLADRARVPSGQPDHGRALDRALGEARDALRLPGCRSRSVSVSRAWVSLARACPRRRELRRGHLPEHGAARPGRRHGLQPGAARGDERRRAAKSRVSLRGSSTRRS